MPTTVASVSRIWGLLCFLCGGLPSEYPFMLVWCSWPDDEPSSCMACIATYLLGIS
jgi:hypothetical protein